MNSNRQPVEEHDPREPPRATFNAQPIPKNSNSSMAQVDIAARSFQGCDRPDNDDHHLVLRIERSLETVLTNLPETVLPHRFDETAYGMLVAAGLGGMPESRMASALAVCKLIELVVDTPDWIMRMDRRKAGVVKQRMAERFRKIDEALKQRARKDSVTVGVSVTLTVGCSLGTDLFLSHIGDSRAYLLRGDKLHQLTRDHTLAQALIDAGIGEAESTIVRGMRRVLTDALGISRLQVHPQVEHLQLCDGDQLLLCTRGFIEAVDPETVQSILRNASPAEEACRALIKITRVGDENATVILARYHFPQAA
jgi:serine/threonine protein phosphatase PrpC